MTPGLHASVHRKGAHHSIRFRSNRDPRHRLVMKQTVAVLSMLLYLGRAQVQEPETYVLHQTVSNRETIVYTRVIHFDDQKRLFHVQDYSENGRIQMDAFYRMVQKLDRRLEICDATALLTVSEAVTLGRKSLRSAGGLHPSALAGLPHSTRGLDQSPPAGGDRLPAGGEPRPS